MPLTDFWEVKDNQQIANQNVLNIYHVKRIQVGATALTIAQAFTNTILSINFRGMQSNGLTRTTVEVQNLGDALDFVSFDSSAFVGTDTGDHPAIFNAASVQFNRTRTDMKNGQKRWMMGAEVDAVNGIYSAAFVAQLELVGDTMVAPWFTAAAPLVDVCSFTILRRFCIVPAQDPCVAYRLPNTDTEIDAWHYVPVFYTVRSRVRSQVSRKRL